MPDLPARRIDDREQRPELALAAEAVRDGAGARAAGAQLGDQGVGLHGGVESIEVPRQ
jgi:hypothetical protein